MSFIHHIHEPCLFFLCISLSAFPMNPPVAQTLSSLMVVPLYSTGLQTKLMQNCGRTQFKRTSIDKLMNTLVLWVSRSLLQSHSLYFCITVMYLCNNTLPLVLHSPLRMSVKARTEADISYKWLKQLTNHRRMSQWATQSRLSFIVKWVLRRQEQKPSFSDRGWKEELQRWTVWGKCCVFWTLEHVNIFN